MIIEEKFVKNISRKVREGMRKVCKSPFCGLSAYLCVLCVNPKQA